MVTYRRAEPRDVPAVLALVARCDAASPWLEVIPPVEQEQERLDRQIRDPGGWLLVAVDGDEPVGFASIRPGKKPASGHVSNLFVDPPRWGMGIGRALLARAVGEMHARGYALGELGTQVLNERARRIYEAAGWRDTGERRQNEYGEEMALYELDLAS